MPAAPVARTSPSAPRTPPVDGSRRVLPSANRTERPDRAAARSSTDVARATSVATPLLALSRSRSASRTSTASFRSAVVARAPASMPCPESQTRKAAGLERSSRPLSSPAELTNSTIRSLFNHSPCLAGYVTVNIVSLVTQFGRSGDDAAPGVHEDTRRRSSGGAAPRRALRPPARDARRGRHERRRAASVPDRRRLAARAPGRARRPTAACGPFGRRGDPGPDRGRDPAGCGRSHPRPVRPHGSPAAAARAAGGPAPGTGAAPPLGSPLRQPDSRVDPRVERVDEETEDEDAEGGEHDHPLRRRQVEVVDRPDGEPAEARQPEDGLGEERAAEREPEIHPEDRHDGQQGVPDHVLPQHE